jgi:hypothetical protein
MALPAQRSHEKRRHPRVRVQYRSHFSTKNKMVAGDGDLQDLSQAGCRIKSQVSAPAGSELELCVFVDGDENPLVIDVASVRWVRSDEFGLSFTQVRPPVQRRITDLCRKLAPLD